MRVSLLEGADGLAGLRKDRVEHLGSEEGAVDQNLGQLLSMRLVKDGGGCSGCERTQLVSLCAMMARWQYADYRPPHFVSTAIRLLERSRLGTTHNDIL